MPTHRHWSRCQELITETTRLIERIGVLEQLPSHDERLTARHKVAGLRVQYHRDMCELLALRKPKDADSARRQQRTGDWHRQEMLRWDSMLTELRTRKGQAKA